MASKYDPNYIVFRGEHEHFIDGQKYTYNDFSNWTYENDPVNGICKSTMKGRLKSADVCEPRHLLPIAEFAAQSEAVKKLRGYCREARERVLNSPRLEGKSQEMMDQWLRRKI